MRQIGKIGKINAKSNKILKKTYEEKGITNCENCGSYFGLSFAHRHKRNYYKEQATSPEELLALLSSFNQTLLLCVDPCHVRLEKDARLTEETFLRLRGEE